MGLHTNYRNIQRSHSRFIKYIIKKLQNISGKILYKNARTSPALFLYKHSDHADSLYSETNMTEKENDYNVEDMAYA